MSDIVPRKVWRYAVVSTLGSGMVSLCLLGCAPRSDVAWSPGRRCELRAVHDEAFGQVETLSLRLHQDGFAPREIWREAGDAPSRIIGWRGAADADVETMTGGGPIRRRLHWPSCLPGAPMGDGADRPSSRR